MNKLFIVITEKCAQGIGGMESHFIAMVDYFRHIKGYSVSVIGLKDSKSLFYSDLFRKWNIDSHNIICSKNSMLSKKIFLRTITDNSIVFFNSLQWFPIFEEIKKHKKNCRIIVRSGGNDLGMPWKFKMLFIEKNIRRFLKYFLGLEPIRYMVKEKVKAINSYSDILITNSKYSTKRSTELGIKRNKLFQITGGVNSNAIKRKIHEDKRELVILNVGRMVKFKGLEYSIMAFSYAQRHSSIKLRMVIVGDGEGKEKIRDFAKCQGIKGITFLEKIYYPEILSIFKEGDIFLHMPIYLPYKSGDFIFHHTETMGRSLLEASAAGLPIVAASVGGVSEIVKDGKSGFLVAEKDYVTAGKKILLLQNTSLRNEFGLFGHTLAQNDYSWETVFNKYQNMFTKTVRETEISGYS